ncbi:MAG: Ig-like domain-containing protein, partial [Pseudomonadota bacterium]
IDTFVYTVADGNGGTDVATVNVTITGDNDAPTANDDNATFGEDQGSSVLNLVGNDTDPDGSDMLTVGAVDTTGTTGTVTLAGGTVAYDPNGQFESLANGETAIDTFVYTVADGNGGTDVATVNVTITGDNDAPIATDDNATFGEDQGSSVLDLLGNDSDPDGSDTLTLDAVDSTGTTGTVTLAGGTVSYDPNGQFESLANGETAIDTFVYTVADGNGGTDVATVNVTITGDNDAPTANDDNATFGEDQGSSVLNLVGNDTDPDGSDTLTVDAVDTTGTSGTVSLAGGTVAYDPNGQFESLANGETAIDTFVYTVADGNGGTDVATVNVTITGDNDAPTANDDNATFSEDQGSSVLNLLGNDSDPDGSDTLSLDAVDTTGTTGTVTLAGGTVSYDPNGQFENLAVGETAIDTFVYTVADGNGGTDVATVNVTITGDNDAPTATDDNATFGEDQGSSVLNLVGNDTDPDGSDTLTVDAVDTTGTTGTVTLAGGTVSYDPNGQFESLANGETAIDTFVYTVADGNGGTDVATVNVTITGDNDAPTATDDNATFGEDQGSSVLDLVGNDTDPDGSDALTVDAVDTTGTTGTVTLAGGTVSYDPNGQFESLANGETAIDTFVYTVADGNGGTDVATVNVTVTGDNDAPTAVDDNATFGEDQGSSVLNLVGNDTDPDGSDTLTVDVVDTTGTTGTVTLAGGTVSYDPNGQFESLANGETAIDTFVYTVADGNGGTDVATVNVTITGDNDAPTANDDNATFGEDQGSSVLDLVGNDTDPDGSDTLTVDAVDTTATTGTVTLAGGTVSYDPNSQFENLATGETAIDTFVYTVADGNGGTDVATVNVTITGDNDAPTATDDNATFGEDQGSSVLDLVGNDTDPDGSDTLTVDAVDTTGTTGTVTLAGGTVSYDPNGQFESLANGETGIDTFVYTVADGNGGTDVATVNVTITGDNDAPTAVDDNATFGEDQGSSVLNLVGNDTDPDGSDTLTVDAVDTTGTTGTVTLAGGTVSYDPNGQFESLANGETAIDTFVYTVADGNGGTDIATVNVTITGDNDAPTAIDDNATFGEDQGGSVLNLVGNDTDSDGSDTLTVDAVDTTGTIGTVTLAGSTVAYDPNGQFESLAVGETAIDTFVYTVADGNGGTDVATVNVTITGDNDTPSAVADVYSTSENTTLNVPLAGGVLTNDSDPDTSDMLTANPVPVTDVTNGTLTLNTDGSFSYIPDPGFTGTDSFVYELEDGNGATDTATVTIDVLPSGVNNPPTAVVDNATFGEDDSASVIDVVANDFDADPDTLTVSGIDTAGTTGSVVLASGTLSYDPNGQFESLAVGQTAIDTFDYTVNDGNGGTDITTVTVTITGENDVPTALNDGATFGEDQGASVLNLVGNDTDPDGDTLTVAGVDPSATVGNVSLGGGTVSYDPNGQFENLGAGETAIDTFQYTVADGNGGTDIATVSITINGDNDAPVATNDSYSTTENTTLNVPLAGTILNNDGDPDASDSLTVDPTPVTNVSNGTLSLAADGTFVYTPNTDFVGTDSFTYRVSDTSGATDIATVSITVSPVGGGSGGVGGSGDGNPDPDSASGDGDVLVQEILLPSQPEPAGQDIDTDLTPTSLRAPGAVVDTVRTAGDLNSIDSLRADGAVLDAVRNASPSVFGDFIQTNITNLENGFETQSVQGFSLRLGLPELGGSLAESITSEFPLRLGTVDGGSVGDAIQSQLVIESLVQEHVIYIDIDYETGSNIDVDSYAANLANGESLPSWLRLDPDSGLLIGDIPVDAEKIELRLSVDLNDGTQIIRYIEVELRNGEISELETRPEAAVTGIIPFSESLTSQQGVEEAEVADLLGALGDR